MRFFLSLSLCLSHSLSYMIPFSEIKMNVWMSFIIGCQCVLHIHSMMLYPSDLWQMHKPVKLLHETNSKKKKHKHKLTIIQCCYSIIVITGTMAHRIACSIKLLNMEKPRMKCFFPSSRQQQRKIKCSFLSKRLENVKQNHIDIGRSHSFLTTNLFNSHWIFSLLLLLLSHWLLQIELHLYSSYCLQWKKRIIFFQKFLSHVLFIYIFYYYYMFILI